MKLGKSLGMELGKLLGIFLILGKFLLLGGNSFDKSGGMDDDGLHSP